MTGGRVQPDRLTTRQALGWGIAFAVILALLALFFLYGRQLKPLLNL